MIVAVHRIDECRIAVYDLSYRSSLRRKPEEAVLRIGRYRVAEGEVCLSARGIAGDYRIDEGDRSPAAFRENATRPGSGHVAGNGAIADDERHVLVLYADSRAEAAGRRELVADDEARVDHHGACGVKRADAAAVVVHARGCAVVRDDAVVDRALPFREADAATVDVVVASDVIGDAAPGDRTVLDPRAAAAFVHRGDLAASQGQALDLRAAVDHRAARVRSLLDDRLVVPLPRERRAVLQDELGVKVERPFAERNRALNPCRDVQVVLYLLRVSCARGVAAGADRHRDVDTRRRIEILHGDHDVLRRHHLGRHVLEHGRVIAGARRRLGRGLCRLQDSRHRLVRRERGISRADRCRRAVVSGRRLGPGESRRAPGAAGLRGDALDEVPHALVVVVAAGPRTGVLEEIVVGGCESVDFALDADAAELLPADDGVHGGKDVVVAVDEQHGAGVGVEREIGDERHPVGISTVRVVVVDSVSERVGREECNRKLYVAWKLVDRVDRLVRRGLRGRRAHEREVSARRVPHKSDLLRIKPLVRRLRADEADGALEVLPGRHVLRQASRARAAVVEVHDGQALFDEIALDGNDLEVARLVEVVSTACVENQDSVRRAVLGKMPFDPWIRVVARPLMLGGLVVWRLALGPYVLDLDRLRLRVVVGKAGKDAHQAGEIAKKTLLPHELDAALERVRRKRFVPAVGVEMDLGIGQPHAVRRLYHADLAVDPRGGERARDRVDSAVEKAGGGGLRVEPDDRIDRQGVSEDTRRRNRHREVDVAGDVVHRIDLRVRGGLRARGEEQREVRARGVAHYADLVGAVSALRRGLAHEAHGALSVLPRNLVGGKPARARPRVKPHAGDAVREKLLFERTELRAVANGRIVAAGDDYHARADIRRRFGGPFEIRRRDAGLRVGHAGIWPERLDASGGETGKRQHRCNKSKIWKFHADLLDTLCFPRRNNVIIAATQSSIAR